MKSTSKKIFVSPVPKISVQNRHMQTYKIGGIDTNPSTVVMQNHKAGEHVAERFKFETDLNTNKLKTGLDELIPNPYKGSTPEQLLSKYNLPTAWKPLLDKLVNQEKISLQADFEIRHGVEPDLYTSNMKYSMLKLPLDLKSLDTGTYLQNLELILYPKPNPFDMDSPRQELLAQMIMNTEKIAHSKNEMNSAFHSWYISEENEAELETAKKKDIIEEATYKLYKLKNEFGKFRSYQMAVILRDKSNSTLIKGEVSPEVVGNRLSSYVSDDVREQMTYIQRFSDKYELLANAKTTDRFEIEYLVQQAINTNVMKISNGDYIWHSKAGTPNLYKLANDHDKVINLFLSEFKDYSPKAKEKVDNLYVDLYTEVKNKGIFI